jgi:hypothetical protein
MLSNFNSIGKVDFGYTTFGNTALADTSVGGNTLKEFRSGPRRIRRETKTGNVVMVSLVEFGTLPTATNLYRIYILDCDEPNLLVGGNDPGKK